MTIFFLGASNCILNHSWAEEIKTLTDEPIVNESLGSSPSRFALYCLKRITLKKSDVVFLDYTVTEGIYQTPYWNINEHTITKDITSVVNYLHERGCYAIMMINPCFLGIKGENVFEITHLNIANCLGVPVLNVTELFRRTMKLGRSAQQLMMDNSHHAPHTAVTIAHTILSAVETVRCSDLEPKLEGQAVWEPKVIPLAPMIEADRRLTLETRIRNTVLAPLKIGETLNLDVTDGEYVLGMVVNMAGAGARVRLKGQTGVETRDLIYDYSHHNRNDLMGLFVPMRSLVEGSPDGVELQVIAVEGEPLPPEIMGPPKPDLDYDEISIEGVLVGKSAIAANTSRNGEKGLIDLLESKYSRYSQDLFVASHEAPMCEFSG